MAKRKRNKKTMAELTAEHEQFIKGKEPQRNGKNLFDKVIKKSAAPKPRGSK